MGPRTRNTLVSGLCAIAAILVLGAIALWTGSVGDDYVRVSWFLFVVTGAWVITAITIAVREDEANDRVLIGVALGLMICASLLAGLGVHFPLFASEATAKLVMNIVTTVDAVLAVAAWVYTSYFNDDFVI